MFYHQVIETDDDFKPLSGGYDYLVDFMDLSFPDTRPEREHAYEEVTSSPVAQTVLNEICTEFNNETCVFLDQEQSGRDEARGFERAAMGRPVHRLQ